MRRPALNRNRRRRIKRNNSTKTRRRSSGGVSVSKKRQSRFFEKDCMVGGGSFSCEKVTPSTMRSVISKAHVLGNDGF